MLGLENLPSPVHGRGEEERINAMTRFIVIIFLALVLCGGYYFFFYPPEVMKRHAQAALDNFSDAVAAKDRAKIGSALQTLLANDAKIHLAVSIFQLSLLSEGGYGKPQTEDFSKADFLTFIDTTLYSMTDYAYEYPPRITSFSLNPDGKTAAVVFSSKEWADGPEWYAGTKLNMRFSSDTTCHGDVTFARTPPQLVKADCAMQLRMVPKPGQSNKITPDALRQLLH